MIYSVLKADVAEENLGDFMNHAGLAGLNKRDTTTWFIQGPDGVDVAAAIASFTPKTADDLLEEKYDRLEDRFIAFIKALNKGTFVPDSSYNAAQIKQIIKNEM